jgi:hypothetical protein
LVEGISSIQVLIDDCLSAESLCLETRLSQMKNEYNERSNNPPKLDEGEQTLTSPSLQTIHPLPVQVFAEKNRDILLDQAR